MVRIDAAAICASDLELRARALVEVGPSFQWNFTPGHEYGRTIAALGRMGDEFKVAEPLTVEIYASCRQ